MRDICVSTDGLCAAAAWVLARITREGPLGFLPRKVGNGTLPVCPVGLLVPWLAACLSILCVSVLRIRPASADPGQASVWVSGARTNLLVRVFSSLDEA